MSTEKYIILRSREIIAPTFGNFGGLAASSHQPGMLVVEEADLTKTERNDLRRDPRTRAMAPPMPMKLIEPTQVLDVADGQEASTWGVRAVGALDSGFDGSGITVCVLDTGIDPNHPAFANVDLIRKNFTTEGDDDQHGHGTHCAGTIFGGDVNGTRIGIARNVKRALIGKVLGAGGGSSASIVSAIQWAIGEGANVISMSLGIDFPGQVKRLVDSFGMEIEPATSMALEGYRANINLFTELSSFVQTQELFGQGAVIVAASGNESRRPQYEISVSPPAAGRGIISVGALGQSADGFTVARFSNNQVDVSAPGVGVISAKPGGGLTGMSGTSMATPHVAGIAALWAQRQFDSFARIESRSLTAQLIASGTAAPLVTGTEEEDVGTGIVQAPIT